MYLSIHFIPYDAFGYISDIQPGVREDILRAR
jgi:hypothetical protein